MIVLRLCILRILSESFAVLLATLFPHGNVEFGPVTLTMQKRVKFLNISRVVYFVAKG